MVNLTVVGEIRVILGDRSALLPERGSHVQESGVVAHTVPSRSSQAASLALSPAFDHGQDAAGLKADQQMTVCTDSARVYERMTPQTFNLSPFEIALNFVKSALPIRVDRVRIYRMP